MQQLTEEQQSLLLELGYFVLNSTDVGMACAFANHADVTDEVLEDLKQAVNAVCNPVDAADVHPADADALIRGFYWTVWHNGEKHSHYKLKRMAMDAAAYLNGTRKRKPKAMV